VVPGAKMIENSDEQKNVAHYQYMIEKTQAT